MKFLIKNGLKSLTGGGIFMLHQFIPKLFFQVLAGIACLEFVGPSEIPLFRNAKPPPSTSLGVRRGVALPLLCLTSKGGSIP